MTPDLDALSDKGQAIYEARLQSLLEPEENGRWVAIHVDTGDYALGRNSPDAMRALRTVQPTGMVMTRRVGPDYLDPALSRVFEWGTRVD